MINWIVVIVKGDHVVPSKSGHGEIEILTFIRTKALYVMVI